MVPLLPHRLGIAALRLVPKNALSRLAGHLASIEWPGPIQGRLNLAFGRLVGVNFEELRDPVHCYPSIQAFFTRPLAEGARPIDPAPDALVSPCDGTVGQLGSVTRGELLQVKGRSYSLAALLGDQGEAEQFEGGSYATFYLAPRDYHRFHMPCGGRVVRASYRPGRLWPVSPVGVGAIDGLFTLNERICAYLAVADGESAGLVCLVAIGALSVGKIRVHFDELPTNIPGRAPRLRIYDNGGHRFEKGQEWGLFEFGSTIVLVATPGLLTLDALTAGVAVRLGARIGTLHTASADREADAGR